MKKVLMTIIAVLLVVPLVVSAIKHQVEIPDDGDPEVAVNGPDSNGDFTKRFPVYINQIEGKTSIEGLTMKITEKSDSDIKSMTFEGSDIYAVKVLSSDTSTKTRTIKFSVKSGKTASNDEKVLLGYVVVVVNQGKSCSFSAEIVNNPSTGAFMDYALIGGSVALIGAIYFATKSKKKMFNI